MSEMKNQMVVLGAAATVMKGAQAGEKSGVLLTLIGGLTATEIAAFGGLALAVLSYLTNAAMTFYFKREHLKIAQQTAKAAEDE